jgi:hypothetical protein
VAEEARDWGGLAAPNSLVTPQYPLY